MAMLTTKSKCYLDFETKLEKNEIADFFSKFKIFDFFFHKFVISQGF